MRNDDPLLEQLKSRIGPEVVAVHPLRPAPFRALWVPVVWMLSACGVLMVLGFRANYEALGPFWFWGLSGAQALAAYIVFVAGLTQVVPGSALPRSGLFSGAGLALGLHFVISLAAFRMAPFWPPEGAAVEAAVRCFTTIVMLTLLPAITGILLAGRGLPLHPGLVGMLLGLGGGLVGEAVWRMYCPVTALGHVGPAHTGAVFFAALAGLLVGLSRQRGSPVSLGE